MDKRFKHIESELSFEFSKDYLNDAFDMLDNYDMNQAFVDASTQDQQLSYNSEYWNAFRRQEDNLNLDQAFVNASKQNKQYTYTPELWNIFTNQETNLIQDQEFVDASNSYIPKYNNNYWAEAEQALVNDGLHYEYKPEYWQEAESLLINAERKSFFNKWGAYASILLLIGVVSGLFYNNNDSTPSLISSTSAIDNIYGSKVLPRNQKIAHYIKTQFENTVISSDQGKTRLDNDQLIITKAKNIIHNSNDIDKVELIVENDNSKISTNNAKNSTFDVQAVLKTPEETNNFTEENDVKDNVINSIVGLPQVSKENSESISKISSIDAYLAPNHQIISLKDRELPLIPINLKPIYQVFIHSQLGIGNAINTGIDKGNLQSYALEFNYIPKRNNRISYGLTIGSTYENLNGLNVRKEISFYDKTNASLHTYSNFNFDAIIMLNTALKTTIKINNSNKVNVSLAYERYSTSKVKLSERKLNEDNLDVYTSTDNPNNWGITDIFKPNNFSVRFGYEKLITPRLALSFESRIGIGNRINYDKIDKFYNIDKINSSQNLTGLIGLNYNIFNH